MSSYFRRFANPIPFDPSKGIDLSLAQITTYTAPPTTNFRDNEVQNAIKSLLRTGSLEIVFKKKDGTKRKMRCTLHKEFVKPYIRKTEGTLKKDEDDPFPEDKRSNVVAVWDLEKEAWRSIRWDSILEYTSF